MPWGTCWRKQYFFIVVVVVHVVVVFVVVIIANIDATNVDIVCVGGDARM